MTETDKVVREGTAHFGGGRKVLDPFDDVARDPFRDAGSVGANDEAHVRVFGGFQERAAASPFVVVVPLSHVAPSCFYTWYTIIQ